MKCSLNNCKFLDLSDVHKATVLLLDTSCNVSEEFIGNLNKAINDAIECICENETRARVADVAIVEFNSDARVIQDFMPACEMKPITLGIHEGGSVMGAGINLALDKVREIIHLYDDFGVVRTAAAIVMITNGNHTDDISVAIQRIRMEDSKGVKGKFKFYIFGTPECNLDVLTSISRKGLVFKDTDVEKARNFIELGIFEFARAVPGEMMTLPANLQAVPQDWS